MRRSVDLHRPHPTQACPNDARTLLQVSTGLEDRALCPCLRHVEAGPDLTSKKTERCTKVTDKIASSFRGSDQTTDHLSRRTYEGEVMGGLVAFRSALGWLPGRVARNSRATPETATST